MDVSVKETKLRNNVHIQEHIQELPHQFANGFSHGRLSLPPLPL